MAAVLACGPEALLSHRSAGALWGLVPRSRRWPEVTRPRSFRTQAGISAHMSSVEGDEVGEVEGIPVTSPFRTLFDLAGVLSVRAARAGAERGSRCAQLRDRVSLARAARALPGRAGRRRGCDRCSMREAPRGSPATISRRRSSPSSTPTGFPALASTRTLRCGGRFFEVDCLWQRAAADRRARRRAVHGTGAAFERTASATGMLVAEGWRVDPRSPGGSSATNQMSSSGPTAPARAEPLNEPREGPNRRSARGAATAYPSPMSHELFEHYLRDESRRGPGREGAFTGAAGGAACGDLSRISLEIEDGRVAAGQLRRRGLRGDPGGDRGGRRDGRRRAGARRRPDRHRRGRSRARRPDAGQAPRRPARRRRPAPRPRHRRRLDRAARRSDRPDRVLVAMSGGVDSAVAALLERERGADVVGVTLKLWTDPETDGAKACCSPEAVLGARAVAHSIDVPHLTLDLEEEFRRRVVGSFLSGYAAGATPNPCIVCNGEVRIAAMIDLAERLGATHLVTGHYARIVDDGDGPLLAAAADEAKDQSYMLAALPPELLAKVALPAHRAEQAGGPRDRRPQRPLDRPEAREPGPLLPRRPGQGAVPATPRRPAAARRGGPRRRGQVDSAATTGHHNFTVGQRRGIGVSAPEALYVVATDAEANTVTVGTREELGDLPRPPPRRPPPPRRRRASTGSASATTRARSRPASAIEPRPRPPRGARGRAGRGVHRRRLPARPRCCSPATRSSATARSPPRPDAAPAAAESA